MQSVFSYLWLIPLLPGIGALVIGLFGKRLLSRRLIGLIACGTVLLSFTFSVAVIWQLRSVPPLGEERTMTSPAGEWPAIAITTGARRVEVTVYEWISAGSFMTTTGHRAEFRIPVAYQLDPLSAIMLLVVCGVGFLIHVYSIGYMHGEEGFYRYFAYLNLFMFSMLTLVLGNNFLIMFVGWEGVGLCSYLLIGFYFDKDFAATAGKKAFVVNRIGDFGFVLGMLALFHRFGTLDFSDIMQAVTAPGAFLPGDKLLTAAALLLFLGAAGKSAQIPLYVWLPDAMAGPTPVSALIHAATMVTSGVYMIVRCNPIYQLAPEAMLVVAVIAAATALFAATIAIAQNDIKKVLAYSTVSQLGYMFLALGVGAFTAGIFHLMTHAFFKALLFLGSGSVIHAMSGDQDIRHMGGLAKRIPVTCFTFLAGCLAISGFPPLLVSGFFSKDEILGKAFDSEVLPDAGRVLWAVGFVTAGLTAFYMFRLFFLTFTGRCRATEEQKHHIHESPRTMLAPLVILAFLSIVGGFVGIPHAISGPLGLGPINKFDQWLQPVIWHHEEPTLSALAHAEPGRLGIEEHEAPASEYLLMGLTTLLAMGGIGLAYSLYLKQPKRAKALAAAWPRLHALLRDKYRVDEFYEVAVVAHAKWWCSRAADFDSLIIDGIVNLAARLTRLASSLSIAFDKYVVDGLVNFTGWICEEGSYSFRKLQTGLVQNYILITVVATLGILGFFLL